MTSLQRSSSSVHTTVQHLCNKICKILRILSQKQFEKNGTNQIQSHYNCCCDAHYVQYLFRHQSGNFGKQRAKQIQKQNAADAKTNRRGKSNSCLKIDCIVCNVHAMIVAFLQIFQSRAKMPACRLHIPDNTDQTVRLGFEIPNDRQQLLKTLHSTSQ